MKIIFDHQIFAMQRFGGISRYFCALASHLNSIDGVSAKIIAPLHFNEYLRSASNGVGMGQYVPYAAKMESVLNFIDPPLFSLATTRQKPNIIHETYYPSRSPMRSTARRVITIHDTIPERFPSSFSKKDQTARNKKAAIDRADHIFCNSENTRRDVIDAYKVPGEKLSVTYLAYDKLNQATSTAAGLVGGFPYLLYVGKRDGYKNFGNFISAFASSTWLRSNCQVICFGGGAFSSGEREQMAKLGLSEQLVRQIGGKDDRLAALYNGAAAFVYPSQYEGFGIPPLEAMSLGCPVICSQTSSIPEVVGDAGEYFDPEDVQSIASSIERVLQFSDLRSSLIARGYKRCEVFSWQRCAQDTLAVYRKLV